MSNGESATDRTAFRMQMAAIIAGGNARCEGRTAAEADDTTNLAPLRPNGPAGAPVARSVAVGADSGAGRNPCPEPFVPRVPASLDELGIPAGEVEALVLKVLLNYGTSSGADIAEQIKLPLRLLEGLLRQLKQERSVVYKAAAGMGDYVYELTESGHDRARRLAMQCGYFGAAPVSLSDYVAGVQAQSVRKQRPTMADLRRAFADLLIKEDVLKKLGQAVRSGLGLFLYGASGNGKTSIAERITRAFSQNLWVPRAIGIDGEIIRIYDPTKHEVLCAADASDAQTAPWIDKRWIRIRRPTIVVGGELTMDNLEITANKATGLSEAPVQMKSNGGTLVIDDFGRQRVRPGELLNRWIVPLEKRVDILNLGSGRKIDVPFDQLIVFSTNLDPKDLVDEAFLRRIPYKIDVRDPSEAEFRDLLGRTAKNLGIEYREGSVDYLMEKYYRGTGRRLRYCHARDLVEQIHTYCDFLDEPLVMTPEAVDAAADNYFAVL